MLRALIRRFALVLLLLPPVAAADTAATVTILEGEAALVRGTTRYFLAEGVRLQEGDIIHTADKALVRLEFTDGSMIDLGPGVHLLITGTPSRGWQHTLLSGLLKLTCGKQAKVAHQMSTPQFSLATSNAVIVVQASASDGSLFVESGDVRIAEAAPRGANAPPRVKGGDFYARRGGQKGAVTPRPPQAFVSALPRGFLDTLPSRVVVFKDRNAPPKRAEEVSYGDIEIWLKAEREVRRPLMRRWQPRARDPAFRDALVANLRHHPEWDPILFPEKYKPKEERAAAPAATE